MSKKSWEDYSDEFYSRKRPLSSELKKFLDFERKILDFVIKNEGIPPEEFEKVLRKAEKMMEPFDPNKTYYDEELIQYIASNKLEYHYKCHPEDIGVKMVTFSNR